MSTPSEKNPAITRFLEEQAGRSTAIKNFRCIEPPLGCGRALCAGDFSLKDRVVLAEYRISGLCPACQDKVFGLGDFPD